MFMFDKPETNGDEQTDLDYARGGTPQEAFDVK